MDEEGEIPLADVPELPTDADATPDAETPPTPDPSATPEDKEKPPSLLDTLLAGDKLPDDLAFLRAQALENEGEFTPADLEALPPRGKALLAAILARAEKAKQELSTTATETNTKVSEAHAALKRAQEERRRQLEWAEGEKVKQHRQQVQQVLADQTPINPQDPNALAQMVERLVAQKLNDLWSAVDEDAQARQQQVERTALDEAFNQYVSQYQKFAEDHRTELVVDGQKETVKRWTGAYDQQGQPVVADVVVDKRSPLAIRMEQVLEEHGPHPQDPRRFRMSYEHAYTIALNELSAETDQAEHVASQRRAQERVIRPTARQAPQLTPPPMEDTAAFAEFVAKNPKWVEETNRRYFGE